MRIDNFPEIKLPVVTVIWQYSGLSTPEMEQRGTPCSQHSLSITDKVVLNPPVDLADGARVKAGQ
ncbi:efflux RND transporter permease subunit [Fundidesulfovibrio terrae]|uniref:efflux RND transporter permease subunit n=1 Tax=Fundidesulfovibrio terrae TaxID=2922866 RepID=UPI001FAF8070|nr:efflux RND transporter permease subunit [Fundidesulfovibrio terrae]